MTIRGLVFDFDGTILDTEEPDYLAWQEVYVAHGATLPLEVWAEHIGTSGDAFDPVTYLEAQIERPLDGTAIREERRARLRALIAAKQVMPGVQEYLAEAERRGLGLAVASSSPRSWVAGHLERLGLHARFAAILTSDDVPRVKPDPALYHAALAALGLTGAEAIAFEDSAHGLTAAKAAGLHCVVVPNSATRNLVFHLADRVVASLADVALGELIAGFGG